MNPHEHEDPMTSRPDTAAGPGYVVAELLEECAKMSVDFQRAMAAELRQERQQDAEPPLRLTGGGG